MNLFKSFQSIQPSTKGNSAFLPDKALPVARVVTGNQSESVAAALTGVNRFGLIGFNSLEAIPLENQALLRAGFLGNHYVYTIQDWVARQIAKAPPIVYEVTDQKSYGIYKHLSPLQKADSYTLRRKAIAEVDSPTDPLVKLLANPNPSQTWTEFAYALKVYYDFGNALVWGNRVGVGKNADRIGELYLLPTSLYAGVNPTTAGFTSFRDSTGANPDVPGRNVLHLRQFNAHPGYTATSGLWGTAKLTAARKLLAKSNAALDAEGEMLANRGSRAIIFPKNLPPDSDLPTAEAADKAGRDLRRKLAGAGSGGIAANSTELGVIELSVTLADLKVLESNVATKEELCALWHVDANSIFSTTHAGSLGGNKQEEANRASIRGGVLPDLHLFFDKLNGWLLPAYNQDSARPRHIEPNTDVYPELQLDKAEKMGWIKDLILSANDRNEVFGFPRIDLPGMDEPLLPPGYTPISQALGGAGGAGLGPGNDGSY